MVLTGGGALLRDLDRLFMEETGLRDRRRQPLASWSAAGQGVEKMEHFGTSPTIEPGVKGPEPFADVETPPPFFIAVRLAFFASLSLTSL